MHMSSEDWWDYHNSHNCHICGQPFDYTDDIYNYKVRDHCHLTSFYRGAAHRICNLNYRESFNVPLFSTILVITMRTSL